MKNEIKKSKIGMNKWTCRCAEHVRIVGAVEGAKEEEQSGDTKYDPSHTFVTSDYHFRDWENALLPESTEEEEAQHIELWNSVVGKDDLVLYIGDFCDGEEEDLEELSKKLNGRKVLIKGNHDKLGDERYHCAFEDVVSELRIDELNVRLIHVKEEAKDLKAGERIIFWCRILCCSGAGIML